MLTVPLRCGIIGESLLMIYLEECVILDIIKYGNIRFRDLACERCEL